MVKDLILLDPQDEMPIEYILNFYGLFASSLVVVVVVVCISFCFRCCVVLFVFCVLFDRSASVESVSRRTAQEFVEGHSQTSHS